MTAAAGTGAPAAEPPALRALHHVAIICSDYGRSRDFYTRVLGLGVVAETYRAERDSWKLDLSVGGRYQIELFSFPAPPPRPDAPEAAGLRHLAFMVDEVGASRERLIALGVEVEPIRVDPLTGKRFCFFKDPDGLPLELYEA
jgi:glyoxylase I family protein